MRRVIVLFHFFLMGGCGPLAQGDWTGRDALSSTETTLQLHADGHFVLHFQSARQPQVTLQGRYTSYTPSTLVLAHERLVVADGDAVVVGEQIHGGTLCAPLGDHDLCLSATQQMQMHMLEDVLVIDDPPFRFMAQRLVRAAQP